VRILGAGALLCFFMGQSCVSTAHGVSIWKPGRIARLFLVNSTSFVVQGVLSLSSCVPGRDTPRGSTLCQTCSNPFSSNELFSDTDVVRPLLNRHQWINGSVFVVRA
jgi:hypothetical protein